MKSERCAVIKKNKNNLISWFSAVIRDQTTVACCFSNHRCHTVTVETAISFYISFYFPPIFLCATAYRTETEKTSITWVGLSSFSQLHQKNNGYSTAKSNIHYILSGSCLSFLLFFCTKNTDTN